MALHPFSYKWLGVALILAAVPFCSMSGEFVLAERGKAPEYTIVIPAEASPSQQYAAEELRDFTEKTTGVRLPIGTDSDPLPPKAILLGATRHTAALLSNSEAVESLGPDGFRIVSRPPHLLVFGSSKRGVLYGVYELLERFAGCRWYSSWHSRIPCLEQFAVPENLDDTQVPAFEMRETLWYDVRRHPEFEARLRVNGHKWGTIAPKFGGDDFRFGGGLPSCHSFDSLIPPDKYFAEHPEYYCMIDGKRTIDGPRRWGGWQPCLSNPDVLRIVTSNLLERIRKDPDAKFYGVSQMDNDNWCDCPKCRAIDEEEDSHAGTVVRFANAVAEAVEKEFPDVVIETLAYNWSRKPPAKTRLRRNVIVCLCTSACDMAEPLPSNPYPKNIEFCDDIVRWGSQTDHLYIWDYTTNFRFFTLPCPNVYALQGNIRFFRDNHVKYLFEQGGHVGFHADFAELKAWLLTKWMWNPELPMKRLLDDFFAGYYGAGAPFVREWFEAIHTAQLARPAGADPRFHLTGGDSITNALVSDDLLARGAALFRQAEKATADDPAFSYNVRMSAFAVDFMRLERMQPRPDKVLWLSSRPPKGLSYDLTEARRLAQSLLDRMDEARAKLGGNGISLAENSSRHRQIQKEWQRLASKGTLTQADSGIVEEREMPIYYEGRWGKYSDDPLANDGRAAQLFTTHHEWALQFRLSNIEFEPGATYRLRARIRVDKRPDTEGAARAFNAGVYDEVAKSKPGYLEPPISDVTDGYAWYDIATWKPNRGETSYFYLAPPAAGADGKPAVTSVWLDCIELSRMSEEAR